MEGVALASPWPSAIWGGSMGAVEERGYLDGVRLGLGLRLGLRLWLGRDRDITN